MKRFFGLFGFIGACLLSGGAFAVSAGTANNPGQGRGLIAGAPSTGGTNLRGNAGIAQAYKNNQRNTYFMVTQPDVDTACRQKIYACLSDYCGDVTIVPGQRQSKCQYASENELYNYALLCLQKDTEILLPQYGVNTVNGKNGSNTAAHLCPSYVQQEVMSYLSMSSMANQLSKSNSDLCLKRRQELEAAMACHSVALAYGNETSSKLNNALTDYCGAGVPGGGAEMVTRFASAGNVGADIFGWAEKIVSLEMNAKGADWQAAVDAVLAGYTNRMNLACGDNLQLNTVSHPTGSNQPTNLQTMAAIAVGAAFPAAPAMPTENPYANQSIWMEIVSRHEVFDYQTAYQVVNAGLNPANTFADNAYLTSAQMDDMQRAYTRGTKAFIIRDSARCYVIPVVEMTQMEQSLLAQSFANCISK
ncbi:MAG: hypothetical protein J6S12_01015 [Alphaproteobacteria bacterium]|nr:hypothetical protein [Alphaproteobacteria bacterium]